MTDASGTILNTVAMLPHANKNSKTQTTRKQWNHHNSRSFLFRRTHDNSDLGDTTDTSTSSRYSGHYSSCDFSSSAERTRATVQEPAPSSTQNGILKPNSFSEPRFVKGTKRKHWKCLPPLPPPPKPLASESASRNSSAKSASSSGSSKSVCFDSVSIRSYQQTMGDNPAVSIGPPIQLDWQYEQLGDEDIDAYESSRGYRRRKYHQLPMSYYRRKDVLLRQYGFSKEDLLQKKKEINRAKFKRGVTNALLPIMFLQDALESAGRKARRLCQTTQ
jgi:hypothetical protein